MRLVELVGDLHEKKMVGDASVEVHNVCEDSRAVAPGDVFVAVRGLTVDGHKYVANAIERGAVAVVVERQSPVTTPQVIVPNSARALGWLTARRAGRPADALTMIGVVGTNGKTTTTYLVESILQAADQHPGVIGTVSYRYGGQTFAAPYTTPTPQVLHEQLGEMVRGGATHAVLETSSAALAMERLEGVHFHVAAFSNLTQDHLDIHGDMDRYFAAKAKLFAERLVPDGVAIAMIDDDEGWGEKILAHAPARARRLRVSLRDPAADVLVERRQTSLDGIFASVRTPRGKLDVRSEHLFGDYNVANVALALAIGEALDLAHAQMAHGIARVPGIPGRVERVPNPRGLSVFVDYAHTPDALERVIGALRPLTSGRLIVVFGCGGDRDRDKRAKMGRVVADLADVAVVTSDNPRTEDPNAIIDMIVSGMPQCSPRADHVEPNRHLAIENAIRTARKGDVVLIAGKGHEDYQILGTQKIHFDDREEVAQAIARLDPSAT